MPVGVAFIVEAVDDLAGYARSGNLALFLKKLIRLEEGGKEAGIPLGGSLTGWRKIVVGDRDWRIVFSTDEGETVATVLVIGDRDDAACYEEAQRRLTRLGPSPPHAASLAAVIFQLSGMQRSSRRPKRRPS